jgi:hypothetical protein
VAGYSNRGYINKAKLQTVAMTTCQRLSLTNIADRDGRLEFKVNKIGTDNSKLGAAVAKVVKRL